MQSTEYVLTPEEAKPILAELERARVAQARAQAMVDFVMAIHQLEGRWTFEAGKLTKQE